MGKFDYTPAQRRRYKKDKKKRLGFALAEGESIYKLPKQGTNRHEKIAYYRDQARIFEESENFELYSESPGIVSIDGEDFYRGVLPTLSSDLEDGLPGG